MSYRKPTKKEIKASLVYLRALAAKDFKPKQLIQVSSNSDIVFSYQV
jgi:hypothetical protein